MSTTPVAQSLSATFDADGNARAEIGPTVYGTKWTVTRLVTSTTSTDRAELRVYRNVESAGTLTDSTRSANADTSETRLELQTLDKLIFSWSKGTPGAVATANIYGSQEGR